MVFMWAQDTDMMNGLLKFLLDSEVYDMNLLVRFRFYNMISRSILDGWLNVELDSMKWA
jgi:hypothetical protein